MSQMNRAVRTRETYALIVMEHDSEWPPHVQGHADGCVAALRQEPDESRGDLLRRAYDRVRAIDRVGGSVNVAILSCNDEPSLGALQGRAPLARALLGTVLREGAGRLELVARAAAPDRTRHSLVALAGALTESLVGTTASVSARFLEAPPSPALAKCRRRLPRAVEERRRAASQAFPLA